MLPYSFIALHGVRVHENMFTTQGKRYIKGLKPCSTSFTTIGKQTTNHAK